MKAPGIPDERLPGNARPSNLCRLSEHPDGLEEAKAWLSGLPDRNLTLMVVGTSWMTVVLFNVRTSRRRDMTVDRLSEAQKLARACRDDVLAHDRIARPRL